MTHANTDFFVPAQSLDVSAVTKIAKTELARGENRDLEGVCAASKPVAGALTFIDQSKFVGDQLSSVGAVICTAAVADTVPEGPAVLTHANPQLAFAQTVRAVYPSSEAGVAISGAVLVRSEYPGAHISPDADIEADVRIMPGAVIGAGAQIGAGTLIGANSVIADNVKIGRNCVVSGGNVIQCALIGDNVTIHPGTMIGQDGFGYFPGPAGLEKMPHIGRVIIQDRVEIGANSAVDRGTIGDTVIGEGTKIDNFVQVAHNVQIGRFAILCGHVGLSGSSEVGDGAMLGGAVGVSNGIRVGAGAQVAASSGVMHDVPDGERWAGKPAQPVRQFFQEQAALRKLVKANKQS